MTSKQTALETVKQLVERFNEQLPAYKKTDYNETQTRRDFIDPFFKALGWDIDNKQGAAESYREVIHEDRVKVGKATKAPDYSFRLGGGKRLFFVEAKKPSIVIKDDIQPAYQVRRYGWSAKLNVSIITDFEEFAIYDCTKKPNPTDKSSVARVKYFTFNDYEKEWDFLWNTFSKEAVLKGSFDKFLQGTANKKGTATVDKEFLISLDQWRTLLAENISKDNKQLNEDELNFVVQQTLDRIIFLRICEDRSIEPYASLQEAVKNGDYYKNLLQLFKQADDKYNSGLFDFKKDTLSHTLQINNKALKSIITQLYYPECPYEFSVLSVEILGSAYEQFLGKTITINAKGKAVIELKPEVRKAGGVYYTPQYIVDYIVQNTIGKLCENKTPKEVAEIKIVDPACGSGSFLLGAYQYLLHWHKDYYTHNPNKKNPLTPEGNLTTAEKKRILLNNIYGVDIDTNAVEVTKLSLLLKCMEGETQASIAHQFTMFNDRVLPTLDENIKSGNSLIDTDYYDTQIDFGEERKIKPFNWQKAFPTVFKNGGFDVVIGNPPYVNIFNIEDVNVRSYLQHKYKSAKNKVDLYSFFVEKSVKILKDKKGIFGQIFSNSWLSTDSFSLFRKLLIEETKVTSLIKLPIDVFKDATVKTVILIFKKEKVKENNISLIECNETLFTPLPNTLSYTWINNSPNYTFSFIKDIKIKVKCIELLDVIDFSLGIKTSNDKRFIIDFNKDKDTFKILRGKDVGRYVNNYNDKFIWYKPSLMMEKVGAGPRKIQNFLQPKILIKDIATEIICSYDDENYLTTDTLTIAFNPKFNYSLKYILGLLNSSFIRFWFNSNFQAGLHIKINQLKKIPIKTIDFKNESEVLLHNAISTHVTQLLQLNKDLQTTTLETHKQQIKTKIEYHEDKINALVYQLYDLSEEEIKIVENN